MDGGGIWFTNEELLAHFDQTHHVRGFWNSVGSLWCCQECIEIASVATAGWAN